MSQHRPYAWIVAALFTATFGVSPLAEPVAAPRLSLLDSIPMTFSRWVGQSAPPLDPETARVLAADQYVHRYYRSDASPATLEMDVAYYAQPRVGATAHSPLNCLPGNGWTMSEPAVRTLQTASGVWTVREVTVSRAGSHWAMSYWYQTRDRVDHNEFAARWHLFTDALWRRPADTALVRVMTPTPGSNAAEHAVLAAFATDLIPVVGSAFTPP